MELLEFNRSNRSSNTQVLRVKLSIWARANLGCFEGFSTVNVREKPIAL